MGRHLQAVEQPGLRQRQEPEDDRGGEAPRRGDEPRLPDRLAVQLRQAVHGLLQQLWCGVVDLVGLFEDGAVFDAEVYKAILTALEIERCLIEKGKPWQNLIEAQFKVQLRLADHKFEAAETLEAIETEHAKFIETFNTTSHWAHHKREDGLRTLLDVLSWVRGRVIDPETLRSVLRHVQYERAVDRAGYISIQRFYIYAERGLARQRVSIWLYEGRLHIEYQQIMLARYA